MEICQRVDTEKTNYERLYYLLSFHAAFVRILAQHVISLLRLWTYLYIKKSKLNFMIFVSFCDSKAIVKYLVTKNFIASIR